MVGLTESINNGKITMNIYTVFSIKEAKVFG
jgi:hypothetical protein